jgi:predicted  nucleic acid-binding Zn-ribbon protein
VLFRSETIKQYYKQSIKTIEKLEDDYEKDNPEYKDLKKELEDTQNYIAKLKSRIKSYKDIKEILNESMELIESVCEVE